MNGRSESRLLCRVGRIASTLALLALHGCDTDPAPSPEAAGRDSAGIRIVENGDRPADVALPWTVDSLPDLEIGTVGGNESYQLFRVTGAAQLSDGRVFVVNAGTQEVRFFDSEGTFLSSVGGRGEGPGEYRFPVLVPALVYDTILIFDRGRQVSVLDSRGQFLQAIGPRVLLSQPIGVWGDKLVTTQGSARASPGTPEGIMPNDIVYELVDPRTEAFDTIAKFDGFAIFVWRIGSEFGFTRVPFDVGPSAAIGHDRLYVTPGEAAEVRAFDSAGSLREIIRIAQPEKPVPQSDFDRVIAEESANADDESAAAELRRQYSKMPRPAVMPAFQGLLVDLEGNLWLERFRADENADPEWLVLNRSGTVLGYIGTPRGVTIAQIGTDYILGLRRDDSDVEHVVRYRLFR
jgi:hypothetical protein